MPKRKFNIEVYEYMALSKSVISTTRFNNETYSENKAYREDKNHPFGCIYTGIQPVSQYIPSNIDIFVLEMNNETNRIMGIGLIRNEPIYNKYKIYQEQKYNVFSYIGNQRIDREDMSLEEEQIMKVFDALCFKGKRHLKRLKSLKSFPIDMLYNCRHVVDLVDFIKNMFKTRFTKKI
jgi:hypothetical protein